jgi:hypothetical protein
VKFETYLLLGVLVYFVWKTNRTVQISQSAKERYFAMRASIFMWFVGFLLLAAFLFLPNKVRVLLLIPIVFGGLRVARFLRDARARLRRESQGSVDLERMKRVGEIR